MVFFHPLLLGSAIWWVPRVLFLGTKKEERDADHSPSSKESRLLRVAVPSHPVYAFMLRCCAREYPYFNDLEGDYLKKHETNRSALLKYMWCRFCIWNRPWSWTQDVRVYTSLSESFRKSGSQFVSLSVQGVSYSINMAADKPQELGRVNDLALSTPAKYQHKVFIVIFKAPKLACVCLPLPPLIICLTGLSNISS
jgi:hypothetical protein